MNKTKLESIIGLEIHVQLKTKSKMFCACPVGIENPPNSAICPICMGHPGTLPVPNKIAVEYAMMIGLALNCSIAEHTYFDRKNYFYPDLPKGYQISQYKDPIATNGFLEIETRNTEHGTRNKKIGITRVHMEEDTGKLMHDPDGEHSLIDFNRAGTPLIEIVSEPDIRSPEEAKMFLEELKRIIRTLGVSDADMEKGNLRCDANISLRPARSKKMHTKIEVKNMNSFRAVERALAYEIQRQTKLWNEETPPKIQETRGWDEATQTTRAQRTKEETHDYRYFPEPDIPPLHFTNEYIQNIRQRIPELPQQRRHRFIDQYVMDRSDAILLTEEKSLADWTEQVITELRAWLGALEGEGTAEEKWKQGKEKIVRLASGWITSRLFATLNEQKQEISDTALTPENFAQLIALLATRKINSTVGQDVLRAMLDTGIDPEQYINEKKLTQMDDAEELASLVASVIEEHDDVVSAYKGGKEGGLQFLIGQVMKRTQGRADPVLVKKILKKKIFTETNTRIHE